MPKKTGYNNTSRPITKTTNFEKRWGISARELAKRENVKTQSIHQRVHLYGTPFQRAKKPTPYEAQFGKTLFELACEIGYHPFTVKQRIQNHNNPYHESAWTGHKWNSNDDWRTDTRWCDQKRWLMPQHPEYSNYFND